MPLPRGAGRCRPGGVASLGACAGHCESRAGPAPRALLDAGGRPLLAEARCCTMEHVTRVGGERAGHGGAGQAVGGASVDTSVGVACEGVVGCVRVWAWPVRL